MNGLELLVKLTEAAFEQNNRLDMYVGCSPDKHGADEEWEAL